MIRLQGVEKTYRARRGDLVSAVEGITLDIAENEFVTLVGPSGCGKSTLLKLVAGLTLVSGGGTRRVRDTVVREPFPDVGIVFHSGAPASRTVLDNVLFSADMLAVAAPRRLPSACASSCSR